MAKCFLELQPAEETDDEEEVSDRGSPSLSGRVSPSSDVEPYAFRAPSIDFDGPPFPDYPCKVEAEPQPVRKSVCRQAPPFLNLPDTIFPNFPSGRQEIMAN